MNDIILHIGIPKTATTHFQDNVFQKTGCIKYLGRPYISDSLTNVVRSIVMEDTMVFNAKKIQKIWNTVASDSKSRPVMFSEEAFTNGWIITDFGMVVRRMREVLHASKIIITIREQSSFLTSWYAAGNLRLHNSNFRSYCNLDDWVLQQLESDIPAGIFRTLDYWTIVNALEETFGKSNILVTVFEEFILSPMIYNSKISDFIGCKLFCASSEDHVNASIYSRKYHKYEKFRNVLPIKRGSIARFLPGLAKLFGRGLLARGGKIKMTEPVEKILRARFKEQNRRINSEYRLKLEEYGYTI